MSEGLNELKRMAYKNACCRCQYYIDKKCFNKDECVWKTIEQDLKAYHELETMHEELAKAYNKLCQEKLEWLKQKQALEVIKKCPFDLLEWAKNYDYANDTNYYELLKEELI